MKALLDGRRAPITDAMGFLEAECDVVATNLTRWLTELNEPRGISVHAEHVRGPLDAVLERLLPLTDTVTLRYALVPTDSPWTAILSNDHVGIDATPVAYLPRRIRCRGVRLVARDNRDDGAVVLTLYGPESIDHSNTIRDIRAFNDDGGWIFRAAKGNPLSFETPAAYENPDARARFPPALLDQYLRALGIRAFDEGFYLPPGKNEAVLVELRGNLPPHNEIAR